MIYYTPIDTLWNYGVKCRYCHRLNYFIIAPQIATLDFACSDCGAITTVIHADENEVCTKDLFAASTMTTN